MAGVVVLVLLFCALCLCMVCNFLLQASFLSHFPFVCEGTHDQLSRPQPSTSIIQVKSLRGDRANGM